MGQVLIRGVRRLEDEVERAFDVEQVFAAHVGVDHGGFGPGVAEQFLYVADVDPLLEQVGGVGVPEGVRGDGFDNTRPACIVLQDVSHTGRAVGLAGATFGEVALGAVGRQGGQGSGVFQVAETVVGAPARPREGFDAFLGPV